MIKVYADFNTAVEHGGYPILYYEHEPLEACAGDLGLNVGDKVILYQDEDDFEVVATLDFRFDRYLGREAWPATPDWSTLVRK